MVSAALASFLFLIGLQCAITLPTAELPQQLAKRQIPPTCNGQVTPACIQALYGVPSSRAKDAKNTIVVAGFLNEFANKADLAIFLRDMRPDLTPAPTFTEMFIDGGRNDQNVPSIEGNLGVQYTVGLASGVPVTYYSVGRNDATGLLNLAHALLQQAEPPSVLVITHTFDESGIAPNEANNLCNAFMQLTARGTSIITASGDGGVAGAVPKETCTAFVPTFPSTCPYVTSVGGTRGVAEAGATHSTGGFSNIFQRPQYQAAAVSSYLQSISGQYQGRFSPMGRAIPDVSAQSQDIVIVHKGALVQVDGTSASALIFGSVIALLNDELITHGKPKLGFLNPLLYSKANTALNDITTGNNPGCGTNGFSARQGWDPVTGLGTPNYYHLKASIGL
ncbi:subtilisin-like protein [Basidiobolus meristosporus CBS 931.73]|uniref:Subtilisin-like protein n=1 Tax=Basidiobolus meristosporus CBS 931.73 TaxID=1314790 RepID=A0A1Y1YHN2_9FUNG|nr:subtilisin-like protein [Basidiobolus meristosporus CBS 931.73]|eukprot:ORX97124.1 subtilisin-like protein [Basidiobolus meristosporus CBS 931.73]